MNQIILTNNQIQKKIDRIAYQILEDNLGDEHIHFVGIANTGYEVAKVLQKRFKTIGKIDSSIHKLEINKRNSIECLNSETNLTISKSNTVILVDDVLNTGETLINASYLILRKEVKKLRTAVLLDRKHRLFPIKADFAGLTLSTTLEDHIEVSFKDDCFEAFLK